jgi:hypothetical protein
MRLGHLLLMVVLIAVQCAAITAVLPTAGPWVLASAPVVAVVLAGPLARLLRLPPLMMFSGPCPGCGTRPLGWWSPRSAGTPLPLICGHCGTEVDLWLTCRPPSHAASSPRPAYRLRWPPFLGIWRRIGP